MDKRQIMVDHIKSQEALAFQTLRAAVTKYEMLAAIAKSKDEAWQRATTLEAERKSDAIWAEIEAAVRRDCERREAERAAESNERKAA